MSSAFLPCNPYSSTVPANAWCIAVFLSQAGVTVFYGNGWTDWIGPPTLY